MSENDAYPDLDDSDIAVFRSLGTARLVDRGEYLYREGDVTYDFFVLVGAQVDIFVRVDGEDRVLVHHGPGRFLGELNMLTGLRAFISARVTDPGEVITVSRDRLHRLMAHQSPSSGHHPGGIPSPTEFVARRRRSGNPSYRIALFARISKSSRVPHSNADTP